MAEPLKTMLRRLLPSRAYLTLSAILWSARAVNGNTSHIADWLEKFFFTTVLKSHYLARLPDRYSFQLKKYIEQGGQLKTEDLAAFVHDNEGNNSGDLPRFFFFQLVLDQILKEGIRGDVAELGVYKGNTAALLAKLARLQGTTAFLFDTFEGFSSTDLHGLDSDKLPQFGDTSLDAVERLVGKENVRFVKGQFPESLKLVPQDLSYCLVHLDCDLYAPTKAAIEYFYPRLTPGGFLIMHDYSGMFWDGIETAVDQFFNFVPEKVVPIPDKSGTVVIRRLATSPS
jgi:hypothetical protein